MQRCGWIVVSAPFISWRIREPLIVNYRLTNLPSECANKTDASSRSCLREISRWTRRSSFIQVPLRVQSDGSL